MHQNIKRQIAALEHEVVKALHAANMTAATVVALTAERDNLKAEVLTLQGRLTTRDGK